MNALEVTKTSSELVPFPFQCEPLATPYTDANLNDKDFHWLIRDSLAQSIVKPDLRREAGLQASPAAFSTGLTPP